MESNVIYQDSIFIIKNSKLFITPVSATEIANLVAVQTNLLNRFSKIPTLRKSLKTQKGPSESANRRRTDNIMANRKKGQKHKHRSTKHTHKAKNRVTRTTLKTGGEVKCSGTHIFQSITMFNNVCCKYKLSRKKLTQMKMILKKYI